ncbi:hypothetical protein RAS1_40050 [Phycisphaerae bacterium RAS1]|nr:hypothetical protein RAS1_40050 [Phycisphaerae bacterium RAS1]
MIRHPIRSVIVWCAGAVAALGADAPPEQLADALLAAERIALTPANLADWRALILPTADETAWERVAWLPTFRDGLLAADAADRPLLLWVMNGHPLGCT